MTVILDPKEVVCVSLTEYPVVLSIYTMWLCNVHQFVKLCISRVCNITTSSNCYSKHPLQKGGTLQQSDTYALNQESDIVETYRHVCIM